MGQNKEVKEAENRLFFGKLGVKENEATREDLW